LSKPRHIDDGQKTLFPTQPDPYATMSSRPPVGVHHPETSHAAANKVKKRDGSRRKAAEVVAWLRDRGLQGATDDEVDEYFKWGHQTSSAVMSQMRSQSSLLVWMGTFRNTRKGNKARVNVLAEVAQRALS